ncbi:hypothetical protein ACFQ1S_39460, partial [Kibdelosporangium lantanae]
VVRVDTPLLGATAPDIPQRRYPVAATHVEDVVTATNDRTVTDLDRPVTDEEVFAAHDPWRYEEMLPALYPSR